MRFEYYIGRRYLKLRQKQTFISLITLLSIAGVTVGVMALIVVIAVMAGFESDLKTRILAGQSHIILERENGSFVDYSDILAALNDMEGVVASTPFVYSQVMLRSPSSAIGAVLRGIHPDTAGDVITALKGVALTPVSGNSSGVPAGIVLGRELARSLSVGIGNDVYLISPRGMLAPAGHIPAMKRFRVSGFFESGMYEFDGTFAFIHLRDAQKVMRMSGGISGIDIRVDDIFNAERIAKKIATDLNSEKEKPVYVARDWSQMNRNLFSALRLEKTVMFFILTLIVFVAAFNIASSLIMMVMEKTRDIAVLKAMGATDRSIRRIFVFKGMVIGWVGTSLGVGLGILLCYFLKHYRIAELTGNIYYFTTNLPIRLEFLNVLFIVMASISICFLATIYPAKQASRLDPVEAIRYG